MGEPSSAIWGLDRWQIDLDGAWCCLYVPRQLRDVPITYLLPTTLCRRLDVVAAAGFFNNGIFSGFPIYLPELYPTRLRATGAGSAQCRACAGIRFAIFSPAAVRNSAALGEPQARWH